MGLRLSSRVKRSVLGGGSLALLLVASCDCRSRGAAGAPARGRSWTTPPLEAVDGGLAAARLPRVDYKGGAFLRNVRVVTVTFAGDDPAMVTRLETFGDTITSSPWWRTVVDSYCVTPADCIGEGTSGGHVRLDQSLSGTVRDLAVEETIEKAVADKKIDISHMDTTVLVYLPPNVVLADAFTPRFCGGGPRAYHRTVEIGSRSLPYAVVPRCGDEQETTATASHELLESTTNPNPARRGFAMAAGPATLNFSASGVEPVDPCGLIMRDKHRAMEGTFRVQRAWSNREAAAGRAPCVPAPKDEPYLALIAEPVTVRLRSDGDKLTVPLTAYASRAVPAWNVTAVDVIGEQDHVRYVEASIDKSSVAHGDEATLTLERKHGGKPTAIIGLVSTLGDVTHMWPLAVSLH